MCISEGLIIKIFKTYEMSLNVLNHPSLADAVEGLKFLEETDQIFEGRLQVISKECSTAESKEELSPEDTKEFFCSVIVQNPRLFSPSISNQRQMLSPWGSANFDCVQSEYKYRENSRSSIQLKNTISLQYQEKANKCNGLASVAYSHMYYNYCIFTKR